MTHRGDWVQLPAKVLNPDLCWSILTEDLLEFQKDKPPEIPPVSQAVGFSACKKPAFLAQKPTVANTGEFWIISYPNPSSSRAAQPFFSSVMADIPSVLSLVMCNIFTAMFLTFSHFFKQAWDRGGRTKWSFPYLKHVFFPMAGQTKTLPVQCQKQWSFFQLSSKILKYVCWKLHLWWNVSVLRHFLLILVMELSQSMKLGETVKQVKNRGKTPTIFWGFGLFYIWQKALFPSLLSQSHFQLFP